MKRLTQRTLSFLAIDIALLVLCVVNIPSLLDRAQAPLAVQESNGKLFIFDLADSSVCVNVQPGDEVLLWKDTPVLSPDALEFLAEMGTIGTRIPLTLERDGERISAFIVLVPAYSLSYIVIVWFVGLVTWCLGVFILIARPENRTAMTLHWALVALAVTVVAAYEGTTPDNRMPLLSSLLFFLSYAGTATSFLFFTMLFPRIKHGSTKLYLTLICLPVLSVLAFMIYHHTRAVTSVSVDAFTAYYSWFEIFHILLLVYVVCGMLSFIHSYATAVTSEERKKLKWILWGLSLGPLPFLALVIVPRQFHLTPLVPEEYTLLSLVVIPIAFVISFTKYRLLDIELVLRRTTVYTIVIGLMLCAYVGVVSAVAVWIGQMTASAAGAIAVALLFEPLRRLIQRFVDKMFFRVQYDFRQAEHRLLESIKSSLGVTQLGGAIVRETDALIPVEKIGFFTLKQPGDHLHLVAHRGFELLEKHAPRFETEHLKTGLRLPVALTLKLEPGIAHEPADAEVFQRWHMALVLAVFSQESEILGFLVLGDKKSGQRFSGDDVDLLKTVCAQAGLAIERIALQQKFVIEHAESERLKELSQLKSDFVSYVSHELRTPLTSIKMFAELLRGRPRKLDSKGMEYVRIIEGETDRLNRMVTNILDAAKLDKGITIYEFTEVDLVDAAETALAAMQYQLDKQGFKVQFASQVRSRRKSSHSNNALPIAADRDAVVQAITNLISNAIKYSGTRKYLKVSVIQEGTQAICRVQDKGVGISQEALPQLFDKFYRDPTHSHFVHGVGLGLPLVKHIVEAHKGTVTVTSTLGKGSTFTLSFPMKVQTGG